MTNCSSADASIFPEMLMLFDLRPIYRLALLRSGARVSSISSREDGLDQNLLYISSSRALEEEGPPISSQLSRKLPYKCCKFYICRDKRHFFCLDLFCTIFFRESFFLSYLDYCLTLWDQLKNALFKEHENVASPILINLFASNPLYFGGFWYPL
jgi:hypothetical protein